MSMLLVSLAAAAQPISAEDAVANQRKLMVPAAESCPDSAGPEVVVCGRRDDRRYRLPFPHLRGPSSVRIPGEERPVQLNAEAGTCGATGPGAGCGGGIDLLGLGFMVVTKLVQAVDGRDPEPEPYPRP